MASKKLQCGNSNKRRSVATVRLSLDTATSAPRRRFRLDVSVTRSSSTTPVVTTGRDVASRRRHVTRGMLIVHRALIEMACNVDQCKSVLSTAVTTSVNAVNMRTNKTVGRTKPHARPQSDESSCNTQQLQCIGLLV